MITLFIDTSAADVSIAILEGSKVLAQVTKRILNEHSVYTVSFIEEMIKEAGKTVLDVEKIMVVTGPGSFTGVRIGVTIAKVYAYLRKIEVIPVSSLKMRALGMQHEYCLSLIDAHHDNYYLGLYDQNNQEVIAEQFNTKEFVLGIINKYQPVVVGNEEFEIDSNKVKREKLDIAKVVEYYQTAEGINPHLLQPNYLKLPQALEERK